MKRITVPEEGIATLFGSYDENLKHLESLFNVRIRTQGHELVVEGGTPTCRRLDAEPDIVCSVHSLGSTYLGGFTWAALAGAGRVEVRTPAALDGLDAMFRSDVAPWPVFYF